MSRIFINNINTSIGLALLKEYRGDADPADGPEIVTTLDPNSPIPRPRNLKKCLNVSFKQRQKPRLFRKYLLDCETIIYDLHTSDLKEVEEKLNVLKAGPIEDPKTIILISSIAVWARSNQKEKPPTPPPEQEEAEEEEEKSQDSQEKSENQDEYDQDDEERGSQEEKEEEEEVELPKEPVYLPFEETDYSMRAPLEGFEKWKELEDLTLSIGQDNENVTAIVLCSGIIYGNEEIIFRDHFKSAWLEDPPSLMYIGDGQNLLPTIHMIDLAKMCKFVNENKPEEQFYYFAVDDTQDRKAYSIIKGISDGMGTGLVQSVDFDQVSHLDGAHMLNINVWLESSNLFIPKPTEEEEEPQMPFEWHCLKGIAPNMLKLNEEFNRERNLEQMRIFIQGPPSSGKSYYGQKIAEHYRLHRITIQDVLPLAKKAQGLLSERIKLSMEDPQNNGVLPKDILADLFKQKLRENPCRNRGFVLDGWPWTMEEAKLLFNKPKKERNEDDEEEVVEEDEENPDPMRHLEADLYPQSVINIRAPEQFLVDRSSKMKIQDERYSEANIRRRYQKTLERQQKEGKITSYFTGNKTEIFEVDAQDNEVEMMENLRIYIERNGRPFNYLMSIEELDELREVYIKNRDKQVIEQMQEEQARKQKEIQDEYLLKEKQAKERHAKLLERTQNIKPADNQTMRNYLMENIIPVLAEGMLEVCRVLPEDPVDFLSEFVFEHSFQEN